jgi:S-DNA-T family DNA segregation ATPase FtsK/SpoIIIE
MKSLRLVSTPTRNRRLNEIIGLTVLVGAALLLLALASYTPSDPSFNTVGGYATGRPAHNWTGMVGAYLSDFILQAIGIAAFFLPLVLGRLGLCWMRQQQAGSPTAKTIGLILWVVFAPAAVALLPGNLLWRHALPIAGVTGRLLADALVHYLNLPGASIVLALMVALSLYLATTFTFNTSREWAMLRFGFIQAIWMRWNNWRNRRSNAAVLAAQAEPLPREFASKREQMEEKTRRAREIADREAAAQRGLEQEPTTLLGSLFGWWGRRKLKSQPMSLTPDDHEVPAAGEPVSVWQAMPRTLVDAPPATALSVASAAAAPFADALARAAAPVNAIDDPANFAPAERAFPFLEERIEMPEPPSARAPTSIRPPKRVEESIPLPRADEGISFGRRADADIKPVTIVPKSIRGYKLPPSSLLYRSEEHAVVREDALSV